MLANSTCLGEFTGLELIGSELIGFERVGFIDKGRFALIESSEDHSPSKPVQSGSAERALQQGTTSLSA
jgi:hypothetical protein